jgi:hypothetical protein
MFRHYGRIASLSSAGRVESHGVITLQGDLSERVRIDNLFHHNLLFDGFSSGSTPKRPWTGRRRTNVVTIGNIMPPV